jgi:hypothetical protein
MRLTTVNANAYGRNLSQSEQHHGRAYDDYRAKIEKAINSDLKTFFGYVDLKQKRLGYPSVMHFEGRLTSGPEEICDLFAEFIQ